MKNLLYIIAGLLLILWGVIFFGFNASGAVHLILILAGIIVMVRLIFNKLLSSRQG